MNKILEIEFENKIYKIEKDKLIYILGALENRCVDNLPEEEIFALIEKYKLNDEIFLKNVNKLWK